MSLFTYKARLADGNEKTGRVTAKSEKDVRDRLTNEQGVVEVFSIREHLGKVPKRGILAGH